MILSRGLAMVIRKPLDLPPAVAKAFVKDMHAYFAEETGTSGMRLHCDSFTSLENTKDRASKRLGFPT